MAGRHAHHRGGGAARAGRDLRDGGPVQRRDGGNNGCHVDDNDSSRLPGQYNTTVARTWRVIVYSARHPGGLTVASRTFTLERGWYWRGFGVHRSFQDLSAMCVTATESFGMSCVQFSTRAG
jgi:hypothetical protein